MLPILFVLLAIQPLTNGESLAEAARQQIGVTLRYDGGYRRLKYPGGDVPQELGVCTDVVIRAYRKQGVDLQVLVHQDVLRAPKAYQRGSVPIRPDANIDHRRVPNLATFFQRRGASLPITTKAADYHAGDLVIWRLDSGLPHIGMVSSGTENGRPQIIHNIGEGTKEEDVLFAWTITGHFRYVPRDR